MYLEQLFAFGDPLRDPQERTISVTYFTLIDIHQYETQINHYYQAEWFPLKKIPARSSSTMKQIIELAKEKLRYKAAFHPILFELLPEKFTLPQLQILYEEIYDTTFRQKKFHSEKCLLPDC